MAGPIITQNERLFSFDSPLGTDKLLVNSFQGTEAMSKLFHFDLELVSEDPEIDWYQIINRNVTVGIRQRDGVSFRYFNGHISKFAPMRHEGQLSYYKAEMVPWLWFLTLTQNCLIYQQKKVPDVVEETFQKFGFRHFDMSAVKLAEKHQPWENCCQYRETAFDFVSRLMEAEGIYYYFKHEQGKHTMMMVNHKSSHLPCPYQSTFRLEHNVGSGVKRTEDSIFIADMHKEVKPNKWAHKEFNFKSPQNPLYREDSASTPTGADQDYEEYDYPGEYESYSDAEAWGAVRQEEQVADHTVVTGSGDARSLTPGYKIDLTQHDRPEQNINYLITEVTHTGQEGTFVAGSDANEARYENTFKAIPSSVQFRTGRKTESPQMLGLQTAIVVGPKGEEIYTDKHGRVKVHFHWDRRPADQDSSCWIRVMQPWAGAGFGHLFLPRVGMEVVVDFLEGDPDRPVIVGCLYNTDNRQPYWTPEEKKNWSGIKTLSTKGGKPQKNYNELRLVDTMGEELFLMHAEKDMQITVENDTIEVVDRDRSLDVKRNQTELVEGHQYSTVKGEFREDIQGELSLNARQNINERAAGNFILQAGGDIHLKAGGRIVLEAAQGVTFLASGATNFIDVTQAGIIIQGTTTWVNCGLPAPGGALDSQPQPPALPTLPNDESQPAPTPGSSQSSQASNPWVVQSGTTSPAPAPSPTPTAGGPPKPDL
jgi:type VI secretion system secreted protein VgrG